MRAVIFYFLCSFIITGCGKGKGSKASAHIKIITLHKADSLTQLNKGIGLMQYFQFLPETDSVLFRDVEYPDYDTFGRLLPFKYHTFVGKINDSQNIDTLTDLLRLLKRRPTGDINSSSIKGAMYCGPYYSIEINDTNGERLYHFILDGNDTLESFSTFFEHFNGRNWNKKKVENTFLNGDCIAVALLKKTGEYDSLPAPFLGKECHMEVDFSAINGKWRTISTIHNPDSNKYNLLILDSKKNYHFEIFRKGKFIEGSVPGKFAINEKDSSLVLTWNNEKRMYLINKLTSDCLEYRDPNDSYIYKYSKVQ